jgi:hypothetical protein
MLELCRKVGQLKVEKQIERKVWKEYAIKTVIVFSETWKKDFGFILKNIW